MKHDLAKLAALHEKEVDELNDCLRTIKQFRKMDLERGGGSTATEDRIARSLPKVLAALPDLLRLARAAVAAKLAHPSWCEAITFNEPHPDYPCKCGLAELRAACGAFEGGA